MAPTPPRRATTTATAEEAASRQPLGTDLKPFPIGEGFLVVGGVVVLGFIATLVVYGLQLAGVLS